MHSNLHKNNITIHYFYHSGFSVETFNSILIFDYYMEIVNDSKDASTLETLLSKGKPVYVFVSHNHSDHFNKEIFTWSSKNNNIKYILSDDIKLKENSHYNFFVKKNHMLSLDDLTIKAFGSTDEGVSFLVNGEGFNIFHAGDLNWWHWKEDSLEDNSYAEKWFKEEINLIKGEKIDLAFFPVDPRLQEYFYLGGKYFIETINPKYFIPMHFGNNSGTQVTETFKKQMGEYKINIIAPSEKDIELNLAD